MTLYLFPNTLGHRRVDLLPQVIGEILPTLRGLIVESDRGGRMFLGLWKIPEPHKFPLALLSKHSKSEKSWDFYLEPIIKKQESWGMVSDAGLPCIADPGAQLVRRARSLGIPVQGFSGPCSITLALMLSGLPGQSFSFLGYLPQDPKERARYVRGKSTKQQTLICIEAPYRNLHTFQMFLDILPSYAELCVGIDLTGEEECLLTRSIGEWKVSSDHSQVCTRMTKVPTIFLWYVPR